MAGKVFFSVSMSLDGFSAPESMEGIFATPAQREQDPRLERWTAQWRELQAWIFPQRFFRENLHLGEGGEEGPDNDIARETCSSAPAPACSTAWTRPRSRWSRSVRSRRRG